MKYFVLILLMVGFVSAGCVDINSASLEDLDEIVWVGPATAQKIIDARPFDNVEDLNKVGGIGDVKISDIKEEGLACVEGGEVEKEEEVEEEEIIENIIEVNEPELVFLKEEPREEISLNGDLEAGFSYVSKNGKIIDWLPYGFALFLIFILGILLWERF